MHIVTSSRHFVDIDALASAYAYTELLNLQQIPARAVITAPFNQSITPTVFSWGWKVVTSHAPKDEDVYVVVDTSEPSALESFIDPDKVVEVIDHHPGFENYWQKKQSVKSCINPVGAAATLIYEQWAKNGHLPEMSRLSRKLLITAILDNTLYFKANICTKRDIMAYQQLVRSSRLPDTWPEIYFTECQTIINNSLEKSIGLDAKMVRLPAFSEAVFLAQLVMWDASSIVSSRANDILNILDKQLRPGFMNIVSINNNKSYFIAKNVGIKAWLEQEYEATFRDNIAVMNRAWLRKEIVKKANI